MNDKYIVDYAALGEKIRQKRLNTGLSQDAVSEKMGLSESFYGHIERGDRIMSVETLVKIARYFDLSIDYLLLDSKESNKDERLQTEVDNFFRGKSLTQIEYLLNLLKVISENIDKLQP